MENITLFLASIVGYFLLIWIFIDGCRPHKLLDPDNIKSHLGRIAILAILCAPFNINGNIYTIAGNATGKNVYSIFSVYQRADNAALAIFSLGGYQKAGNFCLTVIGVTIYQEDMNNNDYERSGLGIGISAYQKGKNMATLIGVVGYQAADRKAFVTIGIVGYQAADDVMLGLGLAFAQKARISAGAFISLYQNSDNDAFACFTFYQRAVKYAKAGFAFYQQAGEEVRSFAISFNLGTPPEEGEPLIPGENKK